MSDQDTIEDVIADLADEDPDVWNKDYYPPPWSVEMDEDFTEAEPQVGLESFKVVCDGYDDETPTVCVGDPRWGLGEADAGVIAAALPMGAALHAALVEIDEEIEQRKSSGNAEAWSDLQKVSDDGHAALKKAGLE